MSDAPPPADAPAPSAEEELRELSLKIVGTGGLHVDDRPALKQGATGSLACSDAFVEGERHRITCTRGREILEVIADAGTKKAVVLHRPDGAGTDARTFFTCTASGNGPGALPANLSCAKKTPSTGGGHGGLSSPFAPTAPGIRIPNAHAVGTSGLLFRGMAPRGDDDFGDLLTSGIAAVLVFKNQTGTGHDVADEIATLKARGLAESRIANIPFKWKDLGSFRETCEQTVLGMKFLATNLGEGKKTFFHCTVGEDRTGLLAAAHRLATEPGLGAADAWDREMCERGYGAGNPLKPAFVKGQLAGGLTPFYRKLSWMIATGKISSRALSVEACANDPADDPAFATGAVPLERLQCGTSTRFQP
ncbi:MAG: hypothetical protein JST00_00195 [Deltaproteobacteria bacterium]|nr:hypothetical protein [Deltaproteobacteria bacterium]